MLGPFSVQLEHLMAVADDQTYRHTLGLWRTDVKVRDRQNVPAAIRMFKESVRSCLLSHAPQTSTGTRYFLQMGSLLHDMYFKSDLTVDERVRSAWTVVTFIRFWRVWLLLSDYKLQDNFISDQTYRDIVIACNAMVLMVKAWRENFPYIPFNPSLWGSNSCEDLFGQARCFLKNKCNFSHLEFLQICARLRNMAHSENDLDIITRKSNKRNDIFSGRFNVVEQWP